MARNVAQGNLPAQERRWGELPVEETVRDLSALLAPFGSSLELVDNFPEPKANQVQVALGRWIFEDENATENKLLYWVGHAAWEDDALRLVTSDSRAALSDPGTAMSSNYLADALKSDWKHRKTLGEAPWTVAVLDCCRGGQGAQHIAGQFDPEDSPRQIGLVGAAGDDASSAGSLVKALRQVLGRVTYNDECIPVRRLLNDLAEYGTGEIYADNARLNLDAVLSNQYAGRAPLVSTQASTDNLRRVLSSLPIEARNHFFAKARGTEFDETAWYFQGRVTESRRIAAWLDSVAPGMLVVTGRPGCGKSALLGRMVTLADPQLLEALVQAGVISDKPPSDQVPSRHIDVAIHLTGKTLTDTVRQVAEAVTGYAGRPDEVESVLEAIEAHPTPLVVVTDALDEAQDPLAIAGSFFRRLAATGRIKLIVGTRRSLSEGPDQPDTAGHELIDALAPAEDELLDLVDEPDAVERYVERCLIDSADSHVVSDQRRAHDLATRIAAKRQPFLFARLAAIEMSAQPDRSDAELEFLLGGGHRRLFQAALDRFAASSDTAVPLLRALAYGLGRGLPRWDQVWVTVAQSMHPSSSFTDADLDDVLAVAAPYIAHDGEQGQGTYRLAHRTYVEHFEAEGDRQQRHGAITDALIRRAQADGWSRSNRYLVRYTASHARLADRLDRVLDDEDLLDHHDQDRLASEIQSLYFGAGDIESTAGAILRIRNELERAAPTERPALRQLARLLNDPDTSRRPPPASSPPEWWPQWARSGSPLHLHLEGHVNWVWSVAFGTLADGRVVLASGSEDNRVRLWNATTGQPLGQPLTHTLRVRSVAFGTLADGRVVLASGSDDGTIQLWDPTTGQPFGQTLAVHTDTVAFGRLADGRVVLASADRWNALLWDPTTGQRLGQPLTGHTDWVRSVAFGTLADGRVVLASGSDDATVRLWDPDTGRPLGQPLTGHDGRGQGGIGRLNRMRRQKPAQERLGVNAVAFGTLADGRVVLASGSDDANVRLWDPNTGQPLGQPLAGHNDGVLSVAFGTLADGRVVLAAAARNGGVQLWDPDKGQALGEPLIGHMERVRSVAFGTLADGRVVLASAADDFAIRLWDPAASNAPTGHTGRVSSLALGTLNDGRMALASGSDDGTVRLWDPDTGQPLGQPLTGHNEAVQSVAFGTLADGRVVLASAARDGAVRQWDPGTGQAIGQTLIGHTNELRPLALGRLSDGQVVLAYADESGAARLRDPATGRELSQPFPGHTDWMSAMAFGTLADRRVVLACAYERGAVRLWDPAAGQPLGQPFAGHTNWVRAMVFGTLADGQVVLACADDETVRLSDPASGQRVGASVTAGEVSAMVFGALADGKVVLACAAIDGTVRLSDPATGQIRGGAALPSPVGALLLTSTQGPGTVTAAVGLRSDVATLVIEAESDSGPAVRSILGSFD